MTRMGTSALCRCHRRTGSALSVDIVSGKIISQTEYDKALSVSDLQCSWHRVLKYGIAVILVVFQLDGKSAQMIWLIISWGAKLHG